LDAPAITPGLGALIFNNPTTTFTISSTGHFLQFNGASSSIEVLAGSHVLNTPVKVDNTLLNITVSSGLLTLEQPLTEAAGSTSSISVAGPGQLLNSMNSITINGSFSVADGTFVNYNGGSVSGVSSVGSETISEVSFTIDGTVSVLNTGAVSAGSGSFLGTLDAMINGGTVTIMNTGPITNAGNGSFFSTDNLTINGGSVLNSNSGSVGVNGLIGSYILAQSNLIMNGGTLTNTNTGVVSSQGIGSLIEAIGAFTVNGGTVVNNDTVWTPLLNIGRAGTVAGSGLFQNVNRAPTIQVVNAGTVIPGGPGLGDAPGVMTIQGSYSQSGTLGINVLNSSSFSQLNVTGMVNLAGNLETAFSPGANVMPGETFAIVQAGSVTGAFSKLINFNIPNLAPRVQYFPTYVLLSFTPAASNYPDYFETLFASNNHINLRLERQMGQLRDHFHERAENSPLSAKSNTFYFIAAEPEPEVTVIRNEDPRQLGFVRYQQTEEKQEQLKRAISSCEEYPWNFYLGPTGDIGNVLTKKDGAGFSYWSAGALAGFDYAFSQAGVGLLVNYDHIKGSGANHWGKFDINHAHANLYATYSPTSMPELAVNGILGGGYDWIDIDRNAGIKTVPAVGKGSPRGGEFDALLGLEYAFDRSKFCAMPECLQVVPLVSLQYTYLHAGKYRERGAGLFDLHFSSQTAQSLRSTLGARLNYTWKWTDVVFTPELNLGWQREFLDKARILSFTPVDFAVPTASLKMPGAGRNVALLGVDFLVMLFDKYGIEASYDFEWNSLYHDQFFYVGCNFRF
jgi:hypothetical protein